MEDQEFLVKLGQRIALLRKEHGWTQIQFAKKLGIQRTSLARLEIGKVNTTILNLKKISTMLEMNLDEFLNV